MRNWTLGVIMITSCSIICFAQAAAEGALTHSLSSGMGSSLSTSLGRATNGMAGKLGQQVSNAGKVQKVPSRASTQQKLSSHSAASAVTGAPGGSLIASVQGGEVANANCASSANTTQPSSEKHDPNPKVGSLCPAAAKANDDHPSVINLGTSK